MLGKDQPKNIGKRSTCCLPSKDFSAPPDQDFCTGFWFLFWLQQIYSHPDQIQAPLNLPLGGTGRVDWYSRTRVPCWVSSKGHSVGTFTSNPCADNICNRLGDLESPSQNKVHKTDVNGNPQRASGEGAQRDPECGAWLFTSQFL